MSDTNMDVVRTWVGGGEEKNGRLTRLHYQARVSFPTLRRLMDGERSTPVIEDAVWRAYKKLAKDEGVGSGG